MNYTISTQLAQKVPDLELACIECNVEIQAINNELWDEIQQKIVELSAKLKIEDIKDLPAVSASRLAYKACGKDPARYRLSAEALLRRVINRNEIYQINNVVDLLNLVSISTGFSIGGYDADKIVGDIIYGIGEPNEPYTGIGRGELNIEGMPVFRDSVGAFGTPTSDSERTSVTSETKRFLMIIIDYEASAQLAEAAAFARELLVKYARATNFDIKNIVS